MAIVLVDPRAGSKELTAPLAKLGLPVASEMLEVGDLAWVGRGEQGKPIHIGIEFKKLDELVTAFRSERLQGHQAPLMQEAYTFRFLLIEGQVHTNSKGLLTRRTSPSSFAPLHGHMTYSELAQRLQALYVNYGIVAWNTQSRTHTLETIKAWHHFYTDKSLDEHRSHIGIYRPPTAFPVSMFVRVVAGFPSIGYELAKRLEKQFGTLSRFFNATDTEWRQVDGIGPKTVEAIRKCLG